MKLKCVVLLLFGLLGCGGQSTLESDAQRMLASVRDLEEELDDLPQAIARYGEISAQFPNTEAEKTARARRAMLERLQARLDDRESVPEDSIEVFYEAVVENVPDYFATLKMLGTNYSNQIHFTTRFAANTGAVQIKEQAIRIWEKQDRMWSRYAFRPIPSNRFWQDQLCKDALNITEMLIAKSFREYNRALDIINKGLDYASGEDVISRAKVYAAYCIFWQSKAEDYQQGVALAKEALSYEFLSDNDRARAYHVIGLCYAYIYQDTEDMTDLDEAIRALNEAVNIDENMGEAKLLLKELRQQRGRVAS
ncbi:MAG: hypothetical protein OXH16_09820 [Gemmatimonadetes bacterium]|nr:hypothetical protein [Gemmatimonadota bacterium]